MRLDADVDYTILLWCRDTFYKKLIKFLVYTRLEKPEVRVKEVFASTVEWSTVRYNWCSTHQSNGSLCKTKAFTLQNSQSWHTKFYHKPNSYEDGHSRWREGPLDLHCSLKNLTLRPFHIFVMVFPL